MKIKWKIHKDILMQSLHELSSYEFQKKVWLNIDNKEGLVSSFDEAVNNVFDDACVKGALEDAAIIIDKNVTQALRELHTATDEIDEYRPEKEIFNDPKMQIVREKAARALALIQASDGSESTVEIIE